jgi:hypothetical protein
MQRKSSSGSKLPNQTIYHESEFSLKSSSDLTANGNRDEEIIQWSRQVMSFPLSPHHLYTDCYRPLGRCSVSRLGCRASINTDSFSAPLVGTQWSRSRATVKNIDARFVVNVRDPTLPCYLLRSERAVAPSRPLEITTRLSVVDLNGSWHAGFASMLQHR